MKWLKEAWATTATAEVPADEEEESKISYDSLSQSNADISTTDDQHFTELPRPRKSIIRRSIAYFFKAIILLSLMWSFFTFSNKIYQHFSGPISCSCGGIDVAEAKRRNCVFTPLALGWLPAHCLDLELSDQFDKLGPLPEGEWPYWADLNGTTRITREEMGNLADKGGLFFTTQEWHVMHCMFTWRKQYRSKFTGKTVENRSNGIKHIHHCESIVLDRAPLQAIWTVAGVELNADLT